MRIGVPEKKTLIIAALVVLSGTLSGLYKDYVLPIVGVPTFASELQNIEECVGRIDEIECLRPHVSSMLSLSNASTSIQGIMNLGLERNQCHYIIHMIGQEVYRKSGNVENAYAQCTRLCNSACAHGVIAEALRSEYTGETADESDHLSPEQLRERGRELCRSGNTCHAVGHALLISYEDLSDAVSACRSFAVESDLQNCLRGVYMEFSDQLAARSIWADEGSAEAFPTPDELATLCTNIPRDARGACFYYIPVIVRETYRQLGINEPRETSYQRVLDICYLYKDMADREKCLFGYGSIHFDTLVRDTSEGVRVCESLTRVADREACMIGLFSLTVEYNQSSRTFPYCEALEDSEREQVCYEAIFEKIAQMNQPINPAIANCPEENTLCVRAAQRALDGLTRNFYW